MHKNSVALNKYQKTGGNNLKKIWSIIKKKKNIINFAV